MILGHICAHILFKHDNLKPYFFKDEHPQPFRNPHPNVSGGNLV